jgi:hypothetical protein
VIGRLFVQVTINGTLRAACRADVFLGLCEQVVPLVPTDTHTDFVIYMNLSVVIAGRTVEVLLLAGANG